MNRMIIPSKNIKYIKLCIISPHYEIIVNLFNIIFFFLLAFYILSMGPNISDYNINTLLEKAFRQDIFLQIKTDHDLISYIDLLVHKLYGYDPQTQLSFIIPFGSIRLKKYTHRSSECPFEQTMKCSDFSCTINEVGRLYSSNYHCGYPYRKKYSDNPSLGLTSVYITLTRDYEGKNGYYNLVNDGVNYDFTIDEYDQTAVEEFIKDKQLKFIGIMFNVYFPTNDNYALVFAGFEMIHYFTFLQPIFTSSKYIFFDKSSAYFLSIYVFFCISVALTIIKLIYEINVKFMFVIHFFMFINEGINLLLIIFVSFYFSSVNVNNYSFSSPDSKGFKDNMPTLIILSYLQIIIGFLFFCIPFKLLSLISWYQPISIYFIKYFSSIFRILPGVLILSTIIVMLILVFTFTNFFMYNNDIFFCKNVFNALINVFNHQLIRDINLSDTLEHSMITSKYFLLFNVIQLFILILVFGIGIATVVYLFRKAAKIENDEGQDEVLVKLNEIECKLTNETDSYNDSCLKGMKKQILWVNLGNKNELYNYYAERQRILLFKKSNNVIAFLKYLFAIKPDMQFKNLEAKFGLVLECKLTNGKIKETELEQVYILLDWLNFVGCKIPAVLYSMERFERNLRMKIATCYIFLRFLNQREDLSEFLSEHINKNEEEERNKKDDMNHIICNGDSLMIYPTHSAVLAGTGRRTIKKSSISNSIINKSSVDDEQQGKPTYLKQLTKKNTIESNNTKSGGNANNNNGINNTMSSNSFSSNNHPNNNNNNNTTPRQNNYFNQKSIGFNMKEKDSILHLNQSISEEKVDDSHSERSKSHSS